MTEQQVIEWMEGYLDGTKTELTALGMIKSDINEYGFQAWLDMPSIPIVESYLQATEEVATQLVEDFKAMKQVERELDDVGIEQTFVLDPESSMEAFKDGMVDIIKSLMIYLVTQEMASAYYGEHTH